MANETALFDAYKNKAAAELKAAIEAGEAPKYSEGELLALGWAPPQTDAAKTWRQRIDEATEVVRSEESQAFFEKLAASINTPHVGAVYRDCVKSILLRAVEAGLYEEPK